MSTSGSFKPKFRASKAKRAVIRPATYTLSIYDEKTYGRLEAYREQNDLCETDFLLAAAIEKLDRENFATK